MLLITLHEKISIVNWFNEDFYATVTFLPLVFLGLWVYFPIIDYKEAVKDEIFTKIVRFFGGDWRYQAKGGFDEKILESSDIATFMKNQFGTSGAGELPFVEVIPQLWVLNEADVERARTLISELQKPESGEQLTRWLCAKCGIQQEAAFTHCWKCSAARP